MTENSNTSFESLDLIEPLLKALHKEGYSEPTPIQRQAIPHVLKARDLLACAQTGTGKTAAFALPILQLLSKPSEALQARPKIRCLILTPTRELAAQIGESFQRYGSQLRLSVSVIFGGVGQAPQVNALRRGVDILVATPGRLLDLIEQRLLSLENLEIFVLDEADRMLDMGFVHDVKRVIKMLPQKRQSLFFSATMPPDILNLAHDILSNPVKVEVTPVATTAEKIKQLVYFVDGQDAKRSLLQHLLKDGSVSMALVFTRTKHGADRVTRFLNSIGIVSEAIHGNKSQNNRVRALESFKRGETRVLVATDIAARGIDIDGVSHVINFEIPNIPETYVHRIGRTARAGAEGISYSFCDQEERSYLRDIEHLIRQKIEIVSEHPYASGVYVSPVRPAHAVHEQRRGNNGSQHSRRPTQSRGPSRSSAGRPPPRRHQPRNGTAISNGANASVGAPRNAAQGEHRPLNPHPQRSPSQTQRPPQRRHQPRVGTTTANPPCKEVAAPATNNSKKPWWKRLIDTE